MAHQILRAWLEIGLGIETEYQNQGFAKEALLGMWRWALAFPEVQTFRYTVSPENARFNCCD